MTKSRYVLILAITALTLVVTAGSLCPSEIGPCKMKCCAPDRNSHPAVRAHACCREEPVTGAPAIEAVRSSPAGEAGKQLAKFVTQYLAQETSLGAIFARHDRDVCPLSHRDPVPTYLLGCSILR